ncbi:GerMN domain-containing protein [Brachyspira sp. SAP_772]|uniref:GerMN domain-containing protein n=1 Tax=Brachyspira sp. SAP_772 TaxID=2608385 RepID=UPI0012F48E37|nr:GerMN domain-containing protein [Brachyspira sp. SAP_772]
MPRYEQLKAKSKGISYTRRTRSEDKEFNFKKPIIISVLFILLVSILFTVIKKYSPMVDIAVKDFFSINHREALTLETTGSENENKISFLDNVPLFNFFIKSNTNETLSIMAYETNSMLETSVNTNTTQNNSTITRDSLSVFFNNNNQDNNPNYIEEQKDNIANAEEQNQNNIVNDSYNYIQEMIQQNKNLDNDNAKNNNLENITQVEKKNNYLEKVTNSINNKTSQENKNTAIANNSNISSSIFYDILKPKENTSRDIKTMRPATTTYSSTPPSYMRNNNEPKEKYNTNNYNYYFRGDKKEENNYNSRERVITSGNDSVKKPPVKNNTQEDYERLVDSLVNNNNNNNNNNNISETRNNTIEETTSKRDLIANSQTSTMPNNNSIIKNNNDYNRVINDLVNPNNTERVIKNNERIINNTERQINNNVVREENKIINTKENIEKKEIIQKAQKDIAKYKTSKANNSVKRDYSNERSLKNTNNEGVYLVEYDENTGSITLIFRKRNIENNNSIEETIKTLLEGATDNENKNNIISCIPKDTELLDIFVEGNTVYLNFNESFEFNPLGNEGTMLQIYQLVYTATQFEGIDNVIFLIDGNLNETIGAEGAIENMPFTRFE